MKFLVISILTILLLLIQPAKSQNNIEKQIENTFSEEINNLSNLSDPEQAIKKSFEFLSSKNKLSTIDSLRVYNTLARNLFKIGDFDNALFYAKLHSFMFPRVHSRPSPNYLSLMRYFNAAEQYDSSIFYMKLVIDTILSNPPSQNNYILLKSYNNIGFTFYLNKQADSAKVYYNKIIDFDNVKEKHSDIYGLATGNLGQIYFTQGDYTNALIKMKIDAKLTKNRIPESYNNALLGIAEIQLILKNYSQSLKVLKTFFSNGKKETKTQLRGLKLMAEVLKKLNKHKEAAICFGEYITLSDSIQEHEQPNKELIKQLSRTRVNLIEKDLTITKKEFELIDTELKLTQNIASSESLKKTIYLVLLSFSLFIAIVILLYFKNRQKKNLKIHKLETELITTELHHKKKDLTNVVANLTYKRKFIDEVQGKLKSIKEKPETELSDNITLLIREFNNYKSVDKNIEVLQSDIDKVNLSFFKKLGDKYPLLTEKEKEMCGLFTLNLTSKDIAIIRNITPNAVKKARQRIRKKLPISGDEKLTSFFSNV
jgi:DNA-binding CsgD family transcriptional regulator